MQDIVGNDSATNEAARRRTVTKLVDILPNQTDKGTPDHGVSVWVRRTELAAMMGYHEGMIGTAPDPRYAADLKTMMPAVRQPVLDPAFDKTGKFAVGEAGIHSLAGHWGTATQRRLTFSRDALIDLATKHPQGVEAMMRITRESVERTPFKGRPLGARSTADSLSR